MDTDAQTVTGHVRAWAPTDTDTHTRSVVHPASNEGIRRTFTQLASLYRHEGWIPSTYLDTMYMNTDQSDWQMFTATKRVECPPEVCRDFLMDIDRVQEYEGMIKQAQCIDSFSHDNLPVELRRFVYSRVWPTTARELLVLSSATSAQDMIDRGWIPTDHPLTRGEDASRTLVIASTSATSRSAPDSDGGGQIRAHLYLSGYVMQPRDDGGTELSVFLHVDPRGDFTPVVCNHLIGMSVSALLANVASALHQRQ
mgnify:CR=1 FL=1